MGVGQLKRARGLPAARHPVQQHPGNPAPRRQRRARPRHHPGPPHEPLRLRREPRQLQRRGAVILGLIRASARPAADQPPGRRTTPESPPTTPASRRQPTPLISSRSAIPTAWATAAPSRPAARTASRSARSRSHRPPGSASPAPRTPAGRQLSRQRLRSSKPVAPDSSPVPSPGRQARCPSHQAPGGRAGGAARWRSAPPTSMLPPSPGSPAPAPGPSRSASSAADTMSGRPPHPQAAAHPGRRGRRCGSHPSPRPR